MRTSDGLGAVTTDDAIDEQLISYLDPKEPRSFFLYAGAGSGKTRSLVSALKAFRSKQGDKFRKSGQRIAVITYTNAACDEISSRVDNDPLFIISTIHSFCWSQIGAFHTDIQKWLQSTIPNEILELEEKQRKGRAGTKASHDRERAIASKMRQLEWLSRPRRFTYNPNGDNFGMASLSHSEVLKITASFITTKPAMQAILINRFPFLLIDESQDTNRHLMDAFFELEDKHSAKFALGLFGDMMQRVYADGKSDLGENIPDRWMKPVKQMNHRSPQRIVQLGNKLRSSIDVQRQLAREDSHQGIVRLFVVSEETSGKQAIEKKICEMMADITDDMGWNTNSPSIKVLTLEHHMAASRMGFGDVFKALDQDSRLKTGLRDGSLAGIRLFSERIMPLLAASSRGDNFAIMSLLRKTSPLLKKDVLKGSQDAEDPLATIRCSVDALLQIDFTDPTVTFLDLLQCVGRFGLFEIPNSLRPFVDIDEAETLEMNEDDRDTDIESPSSSLQAWREFLETPYSQIMPYTEYIADIGAFGTHQGIKGQEFDRVLVVMDDSESRGFSFSYEKLLGSKQPTDSDKEKLAQGKETGIDRTRRLFYVTCTRAKKSLALVAYTKSPDQLEATVIEQGWFEKSEIERL